MATTLVRDAQGQLTESDPSAQDTQKLAQLQGVPVTPQSPAGVAGIGGSPDQSKMAGTPAAKAGSQPVVQQQVNQQDTLAAAQRTEAPKQDGGDEEAAAKAQQLQSLGSLQTRVQALINKDLKLQSPAAAQVDATKLGAAEQVGGLNADQSAQAQALIQQIASNPNDANAVAKAAQFWVDNKMGTVDTFSPDAFLASAQQSLAASAQQQVNQSTGNQVLLKDVGLTDAEQQNLQQTFGNGWDQLTVPQLSDKIEAMRQAEYNRVTGIKAQLATATGAQRTQLAEQLTSAGQAGATGAEQQMQHISQAVQQGDTVTIGGEKHQVADLLKDGQISDLVTRMLNDPTLAAKVAQSNPEFATWVQNNSTALGQLSQQAAATMGSVRSTYDQTQKLAQVGSTTLNNNVMSALLPNWGKVSAQAPDTSKIGVLQALQDPNTNQTTRQNMATALNNLQQTDPDAFNALKGASQKAFTNAYTYGQDLQTDSTGLLGDLTGLAGVGGKTPDFVTTLAQQHAIDKYKPVVDAVAAVYNQPGMHAIVTDPTHPDLFKQLITGGQLKAGDIAALAANPDAWQHFTAYHDTVAKLDTATKNGDLQTVLDTLFGHTTDVTHINEAYTDALKAAKFGDADAQAKVDQYKKLDSNGDGVIDSKDIQNLASLAHDDVAVKPAGGSVMENFLKGTPTSANQKAINGANLDVDSWGSGTGTTQANMTEIEKDVKDAGGNTESLMSKMLDANGNLTDVAQWAEQLPDAQKKQLGIPSAQQITTYKINKEASQGTESANQLMATTMGDYDNIAATINAGNYWDGQHRLADMLTLLQQKQAGFQERGMKYAAEAVANDWMPKIQALIQKNLQNQQAAKQAAAVQQSAAQAALQAQRDKLEKDHTPGKQSQRNG